MKGSNGTVKLGELISALYEEISLLTTDRKLQAKLVYLALLDLKVSPRVVPARCKKF